MVKHTKLEQLGSQFRHALDKTHEWHRFQTRKGSGIPYIAHLMSVCALVLENGADEDVAIAALLHDAVEDNEHVTIEMIEEEFGEKVARIVLMCSDTEDTANKPPWKSRKEKYLDHLKTAPPEALLVSLADKLHNITSLYYDYRAIGDKLWSRFNASKKEILWYYASLNEIFQQRQHHNALVQRFSEIQGQLIKEIEGSP